MIRELPVASVVPPLETLPVNVLLAVGEHFVAGRRKPLVDATATAEVLVGPWSNFDTVVNLHVWDAMADDPMAVPAARSNRIARTLRFLDLPAADERARYEIVHCIGGGGGEMSGSSGRDPYVHFGTGEHMTLRAGALRDALVRARTRL